MKNMKSLQKTQKDHQRGSTLIEILVSILIFSFGLLGLVGLQSQAMQFSGDAEGTNIAAALASEISAHMFTLRTGDVSTTSLNPIFLAWKTKVANATAGGLPNGSGNVTYAAGVATIEITWSAPSNPIPRRYSTQFLDPPAGGIAFQ